MSLLFNLLPYQPLATGLSIYTRRLLEACPEPSPLCLTLNEYSRLTVTSDTSLPLFHHSWFHRRLLSVDSVQHFLPLTDFFSTHSFSHIYSPYPHYIWSARHIPQTITCHDLTPLSYPSSRRSSLYSRYILPRRLHASHRIVAISRTVANQLLHLGLSPSKIEVIYNGVHPVERPLISPCGFDIIVIARHARNKNIPHILLGYSRFLQHQPGWQGRLLIIGSTSKHTNHYIRLQNQLQLDNRVVWLPYLSPAALELAMRNSFCLISASFMEGFDYPLLESQALGLPTLASRISVHEELHQNVSLLFNLHDHGDNMAYQLLRLSREPALWRQLSLAGLRNAAAHTTHRQTTELLKLLQ